MFTGLVEEVGEIKSIKKYGNSIRFAIKASNIMEEVKIGDSIAVNGVCLTITDCTRAEFDVMKETYKVTNLKDLAVGGKVNLERALALGDRFGGHIVTGHVDGIGIIDNIKKDEIAIEYKIKADKEILSELIYKGSVAIDGVSLTLGEVTEKYFKFYLIPHTQEKTILTEKSIGDKVNIECDIVGKYIRNIINIKNISTNNCMTKEFLKENGFY
ncbi:riboflavin synthase [Clostridium felsineum]|uniref:riboflavin synthase n=1 Tax=Clostridium felsineum TaxID=36839 RepID=UPI00098C091F|nr:riboflavin synthase [Clostridium felsineum]URZ17722.1 Riboflavin synthase [Clostridium felsineum DSM 794]